MSSGKKKPVIGVVGPCSSGKSTLIDGLKKYGIQTRHIAQEHSFVKDMWLRLSHPDILIYLHVSYEVAQERRKLHWSESEYREQLHRLRHARAHADYLLDTDKKTPQRILAETVNFLREIGIIE